MRQPHMRSNGSPGGRLRVRPGVRQRVLDRGEAGSMGTHEVRFEFVSVETHPEHYCCTGIGHSAKPVVWTNEVPDDHWTPVEVGHETHPTAVAQFRSLNDLIRKGELIRNVVLRCPDRVSLDPSGPTRTG